MRTSAEAFPPAWLDPTRPVPDIRTSLPGPQASAVFKRDQAITSPSLPRAYRLMPQRGFGAVVADADDNLFLDFNAGIAVASTGHCHPRVVEAVQRQAAELLHYSASDFYLPIYSQMCEALAATAPMPGPVRVFLTNSGTEAAEGALKLARHATGRQNVISFFGGFHGRSYGSVSLTASKAKYHQGFGPLLPGVYHAPFAYSHRDEVTGERSHDPEQTFDYLENMLFRYAVAPTEVAAIFVEPILGEGGYIMAPAPWLVRLRELCDTHGILLVADEVQTGAGRTGTMWAVEQAGVRPDIMLAAKGIASGMPLGAFMARAELMEHWSKGAHGSTYAGSPTSCAAGLATLKVLESEKLLSNAAEQGEFLLTGLRELRRAFPRLITDVRGVGLMIGVELRTPSEAEAVEHGAFERGLLVLGCGESAVRIAPPLIISREQAETGLRIFGEAVRAVAATAG